jgi:hypothetical protein
MAAGGLADVDAAGHAYPAAHTAVHVVTDKPCVLPYLPAGQSVQLPAAAVDEYRPTAHSVHDPALTREGSTVKPARAPSSHLTHKEGDASRQKRHIAAPGYEQS